MTNHSTQNESSERLARHPDNSALTFSQQILGNDKGAPFAVSNVCMTPRDWCGLALCVAVSLVLALLPHFANWVRFGHVEFIADGDDALYLSIARAPYFEGKIRDPFARPDDNIPTLYSWVQFVPMARFSHWLGVAPIHQVAVWRIVGATLFAVSLYLLFRGLLGSSKNLRRAAVLCTLICLTDAGFVLGRSFIEDGILLSDMARGIIPSKSPQRLPQYRVVTPLTNLPFLITLAFALTPGILVTRAGLILGTLSLAACVWLYFFYWTTAVAAGAGIFVAWLCTACFNVERRAAALQHARAALLVGTCGLALGSPQVIDNWRISVDPQYTQTLQRLERGAELPCDHPVRKQYVFHSWSWGKLIVGAAVIFTLKLYRLSSVWMLCAAGFALANSAIITGLEFENYHWLTFVASPFGEVLILCVIVLGAERLGHIRALMHMLSVFVLVAACIAGSWRVYEGTRGAEPTWYRRYLTEFAPFRDRLSELSPDDVIAGPAEVRAALLFGRAGILFQSPHSSHSSLNSEEQVHQRHSLNAWISGMPRDKYADFAFDSTFQVGQVVEPQWTAEAVTAARLSWFDKCEAARGEPLLSRFSPTVLLLHVDGPPPRPEGTWQKTMSTDLWEWWERKP